MYRIPKELDLSAVVGEFTTQLRVGQIDLQFAFGSVDFSINSPVSLFRDGELVARWEAGTWADPGFYDIMNAVARRCEVVNDRLIAIELENGIEIHLEDSFDHYESMTINIEGDPATWVI